MTKQLNLGAICGRIYATIPTLTQQQIAIMQDHLDGLTEANLKQYATQAKTLANLPLSPRDEKALVELSGRLGLLSTQQPDVLNFTASDLSQLNAELANLITTDC